MERRTIVVANNQDFFNHGSDNAYSWVNYTSQYRGKHILVGNHGTLCEGANASRIAQIIASSV